MDKESSKPDGKLEFNPVDLSSQANMSNENSTNEAFPEGIQDNTKTSSKEHELRVQQDEMFRKGLKYHDRGSYESQRDHKIGIGLFNTDDIGDLPPRHQKKVLKVYDDLKMLYKELHNEASKMGNSVASKIENYLDDSSLNKISSNVNSDTKDNLNSLPHSSKQKEDKCQQEHKRNLSRNATGDLNKYHTNDDFRKKSFEKTSAPNYDKCSSRNSDYEKKINKAVVDRKSKTDKLQYSKIQGETYRENKRDSFSRNSSQDTPVGKKKQFSETRDNVSVDSFSNSYPENKRNSFSRNISRDTSIGNKQQFLDAGKGYKQKNLNINYETRDNGDFDSFSNRQREDRPPRDNHNRNFVGNTDTNFKINHSNTNLRGKHFEKNSGFNHQTCKSDFKKEMIKIEADKNIDNSFPKKYNVIQKNRGDCFSRDSSPRTSVVNRKKQYFDECPRNKQRSANAQSDTKDNINPGSYLNRQRVNKPSQEDFKSNFVRNTNDNFKTLTSNYNLPEEYPEKGALFNHQRYNSRNSVMQKEKTETVLDRKNKTDKPEFHRKNSEIYEENKRNSFTNNSNQTVSLVDCKNQFVNEKCRKSSYSSNREYNFKNANIDEKDNRSSHKNKPEYQKSNFCKSVTQTNQPVHLKNTNHFERNSNNLSAHSQLSNINADCHTAKLEISSNNHQKSSESYIKKQSDKYNFDSKNLESKLSRNVSLLVLETSKIRSGEETQISIANIPQVKEVGFFLHITVSETSNNLELWQIFFKNQLKSIVFDINYCCRFTESLILAFSSKPNALQAYSRLNESKRRNKDTRKPHIVSMSKVKTHLTKPCKCEIDIIKDCDEYFEEFSHKYVREHERKMGEIKEEIKALRFSKHGEFTEEHRLSLEDALNTLEDMKLVFKKYVEDANIKVKEISSMSDIRKIKVNFSRECNSFGRCLPIYSRKDVILEIVRYHQVSVIIAETGSGKSTQLTEYLLQSPFANEGTIICTQPRKIAAISITQFISGQIGSMVGKEVGYDVGIDKKFDPSTKIIYMTDYALLKKCLRNRKLKGVSCVIIDEAHERTLYTDLLLGLLKQCIQSRPGMRVIITSATINPSVFVDYFNLPSSAVVNVPGRAYPVEVFWLKHDVGDRFKYVDECVKTAARIHMEESEGDILVFLISPSEIDEAILLFKEMCPEEEMPQLMSLHGKSDVQEQMLVFQTNTNRVRRIIFATNSAETSLTIPGIKYVVDSGMAKEMVFYPEKNKSCLIPSLINKSSADQRKGRAGRTQPGVCYRLYSENDYKNMPDRALPELLKTNLLCALLKVYEFGIKPANFDFVESPPKEAIIRSLDSLEMLELIKNDQLTKLGQQVVQLAIEPRLAKFILLGVECGIGHETAIIAALVSEAGRLFLRFEDNKVLADQKRKKFCQETGDLCTFLEVYKRWLEIDRQRRFDWCVANYISSKALLSAAKTVKEILITLQQDLGIHVTRRYNNIAFKNEFEKILFRSFAENLCIFSGHHQLGYYSPYFKESLFIHPSSSLKYLHVNLPKYLVYTTLMETSRNFILDVTPLKEETLNKAYHTGHFKLTIDSLKQLQINPLSLGPFGEKTLTRYILGKGGSAMYKIEFMIEKIIKSRNFRLDVSVDKGAIIVYVENKFHEKISNFIYDVVNQAHTEMVKEENIVKMEEGFSYFCLGSGGIIHDIIMPGEFRDITIEHLEKSTVAEIESLLNRPDQIQSFEVCHNNNSLKNFNGELCINVTFMTVANAKNALKVLTQKKIRNVKVCNDMPKRNESSKPLYRIKLSWPRLLSKGSGSIEFSSEENCIHASGSLTSKSLYIENNYITIQPSGNSTKELAVKNLPIFVDERMLLEKVQNALPDFLRDIVKDVHVNRFERQAVVESDITQMKNQLVKEFCRFTPASKIMVDFVHPKQTSENWEVLVYFENAADGNCALHQLNAKLKINEIPVQLTEVLESDICCKLSVYEVLRKNIVKLIKKQNAKIISETKLSCHRVDDYEIMIKFCCRTIESLCLTKQNLLKLIQGRTVECFGTRKYFYLFTETGQQKLKEIEVGTETKILLNFEEKVISIYGSQENCYKAEAEIHCLIAKSLESKFSNVKMFDLKKSQMPQGFLKQIYLMYGFDLYKLIRKFDLTAARVDLKAGTLTIEGKKTNLRQVEEHLETICIDLYKKNSNEAAQDDIGTCAICLDPLKLDYYRLENCGHPFCKSCLLLQVECKIIPIVCALEDCGKEILLIDINRILSFGGEHLKSGFQKAALQHFVSSSAGKISYCPTPDCTAIYRVSSKSQTEFHCPSCSNDICRHCQTYSHQGMSCDMFQNSKIDEDYSLKVWMKENKSLRKQCSNCKTVIEKSEGCNHMECLNCGAHMCWLCLKIFPSGELVYDHLPFCPKNQSFTE